MTIKTTKNKLEIGYLPLGRVSSPDEMVERPLFVTVSLHISFTYFILCRGPCPSKVIMLCTWEVPPVTGSRVGGTYGYGYGLCFSTLSAYPAPIGSTVNLTDLMCTQVVCRSFFLTIKAITLYIILHTRY